MLLFVHLVSGDLAQQPGQRWCIVISAKKKEEEKKGYVYLLAFCCWCLLAELVFCGVTENTVGAFSEKVRRKRRGCDWS